MSTWENRLTESSCREVQEARGVEKGSQRYFFTIVQFYGYLETRIRCDYKSLNPRGFGPFNEVFTGLNNTQEKVIFRINVPEKSK